MAQVVLSRKAFEDLERVFEFYAKDDPQLAAAQIAAIRSALLILGEHPFVGRQERHGLRELVISRGKTGFLALYRFQPRRDAVAVLRIRHQRELNYPQV